MSCFAGARDALTPVAELLKASHLLGKILAVHAVETAVSSLVHAHHREVVSVVSRVNMHEAPSAFLANP